MQILFKAVGPVECEGQHESGHPKSTLVCVKISSVTWIRDFAFANCTGLMKVDIPDTVTHIGRFAFKNCRSLTEVTIPKSVTFIAENAFRECRSLAQLTIPDSVTIIGYGAFAN